MSLMQIIIDCGIWHFACCIRFHTTCWFHPCKLSFGSFRPSSSIVKCPLEELNNSMIVLSFTTMLVLPYAVVCLDYFLHGPLCAPLLCYILFRPAFDPHQTYNCQLCIKGSNPHLVNFLIMTHVLEWHVVICASKRIYHKDMCLKEIGLCAQIVITIINFRVNIIEKGACRTHWRSWESSNSVMKKTFM